MNAKPTPAKTGETSVESHDTGLQHALSQQKRRAIVAAALAEFEAHGFSKTSMDRIAQRAAVSKRTVYNHFAGKRALFDAIVDELSDKVGRTTSQPYAGSESLALQLTLVGQQVVEMLTSPHTVALARVAIAEMLRSPEVATRTYDLIRSRQTGLVDWLRAAHADAQLEVDDPEAAADEFMGLLKSLAFWPHMLGAQPVPDVAERARIVDRAVAMMLARYRRPAG
jgi:TetR/AcrR family transcriptional regulator of autoinduction and epiphytic fitness